MPTININVRNKIATALNDVIVCGNSDYTIIFNFDAEWNAHEAKTARFVWNGQYVDVAFTGNSVNMPVINSALYVAVGAYAGNLHTTTPAILTAKKSILCDNPIHVNPPEDVYNQLVALLNTKQDELIESGAAVGDYLRVSEIDENGKPIKWETDSGGGSGIQATVDGETLIFTVGAVVTDEVLII